MSGHFLDCARLLRKLSSHLNFVAGATIHIKPVAHQGHQNRRNQRNAATKLGDSRLVAILGVLQQLACSICSPSLQLLGGQGSGRVLRGQLGKALFIQGNVQRRTIFFGLGSTATQDG